MANEETLEKSISEELQQILRQLSQNQLRFVVAMMEHDTKKDAAESIGIHPTTAYGWNGIVDRAIDLMQQNVTKSALAIRKQNLIKAMMVKAAGLNSDSETIRQKTATELIEWELGGAAGKLDVNLGGELLKTYISVSPDDWDEQDGE